MSERSSQKQPPKASTTLGPRPFSSPASPSSLPTPPSPPYRLTRKRAASLLSSHDRNQHLEVSRDPSKMVSVGSQSSDPSTQVCLCPPEPKIPRPRNAFMLYRQHYQSMIVSQNPGLANPEISKIIGHQWRSETQEIRNRWDSLAEEEKVRHNATYPGYKYQPRRKGIKKAAPYVSTPTGQQSTTITFEEYPLCEKCGKRSLTTPQTPSAPFTPSSMTSTSSTSSNPRYLLPPPPQTSLSGISLPVLPKPSYTPTSPMDQSIDLEVKRRRTASYSSYYAHSSPNPESVRQSAPLMAPPPRPHDPSLTLAPIQTTSAGTHSTPSVDVASLAAVAANAPRQLHSQSRSVEAMVMSIPLSTKMRALRVISPPLQAPGPSSPAQEVRGAVVAIESEDSTSIQDLTAYLRETLGASHEYAIQIFNGPQVDSTTSSASDRERQPREIVDYLDIVSKWHGISKSVVEYITTPPPPLNPEESSDQQPKIPVTLIPGYALSTTNAFASTIPITDSYAPIDHWSWIATMWRGIVGADATVWVRSCEREEKERAGEVEVKAEHGAVVWRLCDDDADSERERGRRRVAFEVGEMVRSVAMFG